MDNCKDFLYQDIVGSVKYALEVGYKPDKLLKSFTELFVE